MPESDQETISESQTADSIAPASVHETALREPFRLDGLHALVTGGASGIGQATSRELVRAGAFVWIADINLATAETLAASLGNAHALWMDVTSAASIDEAASQLPQ